MRVKLIKEVNKEYSPIEQILTNRGIDINEVQGYLEPNFDKDVSEPEKLGETKLRQAVIEILNAIKENKKILVILDCDVDGQTSGAILINYLHNLYPSFVENNLSWAFHTGKQHGLNDMMEIAKKYNLVILPDAGSNDINEAQELSSLGIKVICLDHHIVEINLDESPALIINSQIDNYPNQFLSGAGVTWQFCKYIDGLMGINIADTLIDLCALGLTGDMMSLLSKETKTICDYGFKEQNLINPFILEMRMKNSYSIGDHLNYHGASWYIVPLLNAVCRIGTQEDKEIVFESMLDFKAYDLIPSTKRGHKQGEQERVVDKALRVCTSIKRQQTTIEEEVMAQLEKKIEKEHLLNHKVLLFLLEDGEIDAGVRGLVANKFMSKYQRPCAILTRGAMGKSNDETPPWEDPIPLTEVYSGSMRGYTRSGINDFRDICLKCRGTLQVIGHENAAGLIVEADLIDKFIEDSDKLLADMTAEPLYYVDYIWQANEINSEDIMQIANLSDLYGQDMPESQICIKNVALTSKNFKVMKGNTIKFILPTVDAIKFKATDEEIEDLSVENDMQNVVLDMICTCAINEWNDRVSPQLKIVDYEIKSKGWAF